MSKYSGIEQASGNSKFPFHNEVGTYIVSIRSWGCPASKNPGPTFGQYMDIVEWDVVKCLVGDASPVGGTRVRIRPVRQMGAMDEIKLRAQVVSTAFGRQLQDGFEFPMKDVTEALLESITENNGRQYVGILVKIQVSPPTIGKVSGKPFTPISYAVPTAADLEGIAHTKGRLSA